MSKQPSYYVPPKLTLVRATDEWQKSHLIDAERDIVPQLGDTWEVSDNRLSALLDYERQEKVKIIEIVDK